MQVVYTLEDFDRDIETETENAVPLSASKPFGCYVRLVISSLNHYQCYQRHKRQREQEQQQEPSGTKVKLEEGSSSPSSSSSLNASSSSNIVQGTQDWHDSLKLTCRLGTAILADRESKNATRYTEAVSMFLSTVADKPCFSKMFGRDYHVVADSTCFISAIIISIFRNNKDLIGQYEEVQSSRNRLDFDVRPFYNVNIVDRSRLTCRLPSNSVNLSNYRSGFEVPPYSGDDTVTYVDKYADVSANDTWPVIRAASFLKKLERSLRARNDYDDDHEQPSNSDVDPWSALVDLILKKWGRVEDFLPTLQNEDFRNSITTELAEGMMEIYKKLKASVLVHHMRNLQDKTKQLLEQRESGKIRERDS